MNRDLSLSLARSLIRAQAASPGDGHKAAPPAAFTITISREAGALGNSVANEVGRLLGWLVYDRNILDKVAGELRRPAYHLEGIDERPATWLGECLSAAFDGNYVGSVAYLRHLSAVVRALGESGKCVIVGRGANFLLPTETTLRVRLVARLEDRIQTVVRRLGLSPSEAADWVAKTERERNEFILRAFDRDATDAHHYDLILNTSRLGVREAAEIIAETLRRLDRRTSAEQAPQAVRQPSEALG